MLTRIRHGGQNGSALVTALLVMVIVLPLGLALLSIVDTQAQESGRERTRDRAFNLADSALTSAAFSFSQGGWPGSASAAPSNTGAVGAAAACGTAPYGATLGAAINAGSATARLQPNLNASYDDTAYTGGAWQINVCDDDPAGAGPTVWKDALLTGWNYDQNLNDQVWIRAQATLGTRTRVIAALVRVSKVAMLNSKYGLMTGRTNADVTNTAGTLLTGSVLSGVTTTLLSTDPIVAPDPTVTAAVPAASGVTAVRCGLLDGCLMGALAGAGSLPIFGNLLTGGQLVQAPSATATSDSSIGQLKQQAVASGGYQAASPGSASLTTPPACTIPAGSGASTVVYIEQVGPGTVAGVGGPGDQYCLLDLSIAAKRSFKALVIGRGRVVVRGNNVNAASAANTFNGVLYALNQQRETLGDAATPAREVIRIDRGAHIVGGVAADGKSAQVGIYPPTVDCGFLNLNCVLSSLLGTLLPPLNDYNPAITSKASLMDALKAYSSSSIVTGTYRDLSGEIR